jgi:hypothetical protein
MATDAVGHRCILCADLVLGLPGWDNRVLLQDTVMAPWGGPGAQVHGPMHFSCLNTWHRRGAFYAELARAYTARDGHVVLLDHFGTPEMVQRTIPDHYTPTYRGPGGQLLLRHTELKTWLAIDPTWGFAALSARQARDLAAGLRPVNLAVRRTPLPAGATDLPRQAALPVLVRTLGLERRYPEITQTAGTYTLSMPASGLAQLDLAVVLTPPAWVGHYFRRPGAAEEEPGPADDEPTRRPAGSPTPPPTRTTPTAPWPHLHCGALLGPRTIMTQRCRWQ